MQALQTFIYENERFITSYKKGCMDMPQATTVQVLIFDDDLDASKLLNSVLSASKSSGRANFLVRTSESLEDAILKITHHPPDIILASLTSKKNEIINVIREIRKCNNNIPIVTIGAEGFESLALETVRIGAQDCIFRDSLDPSRMLTTIRYAIERRRISSDTTRFHVKQLSATIESISDGVLIASADKSIIFANKAAETIFSKPSNQLIGSVVPVPIKPGQKILHTITQNKATLHVEISTTIVPWDEGEAGFCVTIRDITEHMQLQEELKKAAKLKDEFIAHVSHELRTPMNGIIGMTSLLVEHPLPRLLKGYVETIRTSSETMLNLIHDLLDLSKIEAGKIDLEPSDFRVRSMIEETLLLFAERVRAKGIVLSNILDPSIPRFLCGDASRVRQVLANLVSNAIRFTDQGSVVVHINLDKNSTVNNPVLRFEVVDTGTGVPSERQSLLFQPFTQLATDPKRKEGGTGLGLVISKKLVNIMGGEIGYCAQDPGSMFWFTVPLRPPVKEKNPGVRDSLEGKRILLISQCPYLKSIVQMQLELKKCHVELVAKIEEIFPFYQKKSMGQSFDIIIVDLPSKALSWKSLIKEIRKVCDHEAPVLLLNSTPEPLVNYDVMQEKVSSIYRSPLRQSVLYGYIAELTNARWQEDFTTRETDRHERLSQCFSRFKLKAKRVLVAEDNAINQKVAVSMLERIGLESDAVSDGQEAVSAAKSFAYDAILMDCRMPVLDGFEATKEIRKISEHYKQIPIIAVTANAMKDDIQNCKNAMMNGHLAKPIGINDLRAALAKYLGEEVLQNENVINFPIRESNKITGINTSVIESLKKVSTKLGNNLLYEVIDLFITNTPQLFSDLKKAIAEGDAKSVEALAHKIKGSSRNIGASLLSEKCAELETMGESGILEGCEEILESMIIEYRRAAAFLKSEYESSVEGLRSMK